MPEPRDEHSARRDFLARGIAALGTAALVGAQADQANAQTLESGANGRFAEKVVLITGATSGIGEATARAFAGEGAKVYFCGRRRAGGVFFLPQATSGLEKLVCRVSLSLLRLSKF